MNAYYAIIPAHSDLSQPVAITGWVTVALTHEGQPDTQSTAQATSKAALMTASANTTAQPSASAPLSDEEAQARADKDTDAAHQAIRLSVTDEEWDARPLCGAVLQDGKIIQGQPVAVALPLKAQAQAALQNAQQEASLLVAMGESFGAEMRAYVQALQAIANGTDTTSTALPTAPASVKA